MEFEDDLPRTTAAMTLQERSLRRRERMVIHRAMGFEEAEAWDLEFWQQRTPEERLSALVALHRDVELVMQARTIGTERKSDGA